MREFRHLRNRRDDLGHLLVGNCTELVRVCGWLCTAEGVASVQDIPPGTQVYAVALSGTTGICAERGDASRFQDAQLQCARPSACGVRQ